MLKKCYRYLSQKLGGNSLSKYYDDIEDLPVWNWWKIHEEGEFKYLLKKGKLDEGAKRAFDKLQSQFIEVFGIDENYAEYLRKKIEIELLKIKVAKTGDRSYEFMIDIIEAEMKGLNKEDKQGTFRQGAIAIEKYMGFKMDLKKISTFEYYSYVQAIQKAVKK